MRTKRSLCEDFLFAGGAVKKIHRFVAAIGLDGECEPPALPILAKDAQCAALARERGAEIGLQERVVEAPILEAGPRPNVAHRAAFEDTPPIEVGDWMLIEQVLTAIAQVDPHQRHAISTAVGQ